MGKGGRWVGLAQAGRLRGTCRPGQTLGSKMENVQQVKTTHSLSQSGTSCAIIATTSRPEQLGDGYSSNEYSLCA